MSAGQVEDMTRGEPTAATVYLIRAHDGARHSACSELAGDPVHTDNLQGAGSRDSAPSCPHRTSRVHLPGGEPALALTQGL